jgi:hypothetical protein
MEKLIISEKFRNQTITNKEVTITFCTGSVLGRVTRLISFMVLLGLSTRILKKRCATAFLLTNIYPFTINDDLPNLFDAFETGLLNT